LNPIKVFHIGKFYPPVPGGIENFLMDLVNAQIKLGMDVRVIVHDDKNYSKNPSQNSDFLKKVPTYGKFLYAPLAPAFRGEIIRQIKDFKPDIIHLHMPNTSVFWLLFIEEALKIPWMIHWHADVVFSKINRLLAFAYNFYKPFETRVLKKAEMIIVTSPSYLKTSDTLSPFKDKCEILQLGINSERFPDINELPIEWANKCWNANNSENKRILTVGRLTYYKGFHNLINALKYVNNIKLIIVGEGEQKKNLSELIKKNDFENNVSITGFLSEDKLFALFASCDFFCLPSTERTEAFGLVLLESLIYKKPFIVSDVEGSGMSWILEKTGAGIPFAHDKISSLVFALNEIFDNSSYIIKKNADKGLPDEFNILFIAEKIESLYKRLLDA
jgi:rhamnosyl/mannosyltransferase